MVITGIEELSRGRYKLRLSDDSIICLYRSDISGLDISEGMDMDASVYDRIFNEILPKRARLRILNLLAKRPYTEYKLRIKLHDGGYPDPVIDGAISYVKDLHLIDDFLYSKDYIFQYGSVKSRKRMMSDLLGKGVPKDIIDSAFKSMEEDGDMAKEDPLIYRLMEKRHFDVDNSTFEEKQKMIRFLYGRGFDREAIERCLKQS